MLLLFTCFARNRLCLRILDTCDVRAVTVKAAARHAETVRQRDKWRHAYRQGCRHGHSLSKNVEKSLTGRAQRDDRRASADWTAKYKSTSMN
jgi:hypothetical protein